MISDHKQKWAVSDELVWIGWADTAQMTTASAATAP